MPHDDAKVSTCSNHSRETVTRLFATSDAGSKFDLHGRIKVMMPPDSLPLEGRCCFLPYDIIPHLNKNLFAAKIFVRALTPDQWEDSVNR